MTNYGRIFHYTIAPGGRTYTMLSLDISSQSILTGAFVNARGKLTSLPDRGDSLDGLTINLTVTAPDNTMQHYNTTIYYTDGRYTFDNLSGFTQKGIYIFQCFFESTNTLYTSASDVKSLLVSLSAGYAIIVQGKISNGEGLASHNKTTSRVYQWMKRRGFPDEDIYYLNYDATQEGVDALPTRSSMQNAIEVWAKGKMNNTSAPLWIIMVDHGYTGTFYLGDETITSSDLFSWLETLDGYLNDGALAENKIVEIGACYSGSFISDLSARGRVIITSAVENEDSYKGPMEPDDIRSGEYFIEELFNRLKKGYPLKKAFKEATKTTEKFTKKGGGLIDI